MGRRYHLTPRRSRCIPHLLWGTCAVACLAVMVEIAGCSSSSNTASATAIATYEGGRQSAQLRAALADGRVTFDEYEAGFLRYKDCLSRAGYPLTDVHFDQSKQLYTFVVGAPAVESGADDSCYVQEFEPLDRAWQTDLSRPGNFDATVVSWYRDCLNEAGVSVPAGMSAPEYLQLMTDNGLDPMECIRAHGGGA